MYHRFLVRWRHFRVSGARWLRGSWSYLVLLFVIVLPLLWMAVVLAVRSGMFDLSGTAPGADTTGVFATFIAGGLATAGTLFAALLTYTHNKRAGLHLQLDTVIKSLDSLAAGKKPRVAGAIATMVVLGHQAVAMRVLDPAWEEGEVDPATATWLIDQVLQNEHRDDVAAREAAAILAKHAAHLVDPALHGMIYFPDHYTSGWNGKAVPPKEARLSLLKAMTKALTSQPKSWWLSTGQPMLWPGRVFLRCAAEDVDPSVRTSAAVLLDAVCHCFPKLREQLGEKPVAKALARAEQAALRHGGHESRLPARAMPAERMWQLAEETKAWGDRHTEPQRLVPDPGARGRPEAITHAREGEDVMTQKCTSPVIAGLPPENDPAAVLVDVRAGAHPDEGFDRVVFDFRDNTSTPGFSVGYVPRIIQDPSGIPLTMLPGAKLLVSMRWAAAHDDGTATVPAGDLDLRPGLSRVKQVKLAGDFEAVLSFGIAVDPASDPPPFRAFTLSGNRLVVDVAHAGKSPWYCGQVFFGDHNKIVAAIDPPVTAVERRLTKPATAGAALAELFAGPNEAERERGLVFVDSHATGFADLRISEWKVAHVRLLGPISSDGSAVITIASEIIPTLKQFATVDWVKIYDEDGKTENPDGPVDSIPEQLEP